MEVSLCWLRSDLRLTDNTALWQAQQRGRLVALYYITPGQWRRHDMADCRANFILAQLRSLRDDLQARGIPLVVRQQQNYSDIPDDICRLAKQFGAGYVSWNREYAVNEKQRDRRVREALQDIGVQAAEYDDYYILPPGSVCRDGGEAYQVFTPYSRAWKRVLGTGPVEILPEPATQSPLDIEDPGTIPATLEAFPGGFDDGVWPCSESAASNRLRHFVRDRLADYDKGRDIPADDGTSCLSPYLAIGAISARQCLHAALQQNRGELNSGSKAIQTWIKELIWRDFYGHILAANPGLSKHQPFRPETSALPWRDDDQQLRAWCQGRTGIPMVDAGMRQLLATGWMHNRLRMVTAMFLSKNLLLDWRLGERHFMRHLLDGDLAQNNGGWQWSASTGTDAVPYFRIFNPFNQGQRFDPQGEYIRRWVPELSDLPGDALHDPKKLASAKPDSYPAPIVDIGNSRRRALDAFKQLKRPA